MDLHAKIMNIQVDDDSLNELIKKINSDHNIRSNISNVVLFPMIIEKIVESAYKLGHRDARHKAAELSLETEEK